MIYIRKTKEGRTTVGICRTVWQDKPNGPICMTVLNQHDKWAEITDCDCTVFILSDSGKEIISLSHRGPA